MPTKGSGCSSRLATAAPPRWAPSRSAGREADPRAREAIEYGCDRVYVVEDPRLETYTSRPYTKVLAALRWKHNPEIILFGATKNGRDLGGRLHAAIETGLAAGCGGVGVAQEGVPHIIRHPL